MPSINVKKSSKVLRILGCIGAMMLLSSVAAGSVLAETKKFRVYTYLTEKHVMPIGFAKAPANGIFERRGLAEFEDGTLAKYLMRGSGKFTPKGGKAEGFSQYTFSDGATSVVKWEATFTNAEGKPKAVSGTGKYVSGTGRLEGIQGEMSFKGEVLAPFSAEKGTRGEGYLDITANYTLSSK